MPSTTGTEIEIDDEDYEEMVEQLEAFKLSSKREMSLPTGMNILGITLTCPKALDNIISFCFFV